MVNRLLLSLTALIVALSSSVAQASNNTLELTVKTQITPSTCTVQLQDRNNQPTATVDIGDVYLPAVRNKSNSQQFSLVFSHCEGLVENQAWVTVKPSTGCDGNGVGSGYKNALSGTGAADGVSAEIWSTDTPAGSGAVQFTCASSTQRLIGIDVRNAKDQQTVAEVFSTRIVPAAGSGSANLQAGNFSTHTVFTVIYE
ncbi:fimbrial protein [Pseudocitrobacter cyperus]|uniref:Fimbrial protein n=1 Tax=Pseudocitrobacter cyperus TaxID=3112843 RepID=A0ABV0HIQ2_9ENTR